MRCSPRCYVEFITNKGVKTIWTNGGLGFSANELNEVKQKLDDDPRVVKYKIIQHKLLRDKKER